MAAARVKKTSAGPKPLYAIFGTDAFLKTQALRRVLNEVLGADPDPMAVIELDGPTAQLADVLDELRTPSLLTPIRVVVLREADAFISDRAKGGKDDERDEAGAPEAQAASVRRKGLEKYYESGSPSGVLVLVLRSLPGNWRISKLAASIGEVVECSPPKRDAVQWAVGWASAWARSVHRCELEPTAASRLLELAGVNCGRLDSELSKLASYAAPRTRITVADVEEVVSSRREENVFALSDALGRRDAAAALDRWQQVLATDRAAPYRAVGGLAWAFRRCATARRLLDEGVPPMEAARRSGFYGNSDMMRQQIGPFNARQLEDFLICLLRIDVGTKTGLGSTERAVEKLVVEMCGMPAAKDRK